MSEGINLLVDARGIDASGIGRFLREVLSRILRDSRFRQVELIGREESLRVFIDSVTPSVAVKTRPFPGGFYSVRSQLEWRGVLRGYGNEGSAVFLPHYDGPLAGLPARSVVTVQDLIHFKVEHAFPVMKRMAAGVLLEKVCRQAGRIVVTSASTRRDLEERLPFSRTKTCIVPLGVPDWCRANGNSPRSRPIVDGPFLLCVGNRKPHKNHIAVVEALARLSGEFPDLRVVLAGRRFEGAEETSARARRLGLNDRILELSEPSDQDLLDLYHSCKVLVFPSLYEGFGLPVLEAMACGAPVVASNRSSIPEIAGDAAKLVDPTDYESVAAAVGEVLRDSQIRAELVEKGRVRSGGYSWDTTSERIASLILEVSGAMSVGVNA